ncbi:hypothetical protein HYFRA_00000770 [Hymenoscyphus fraxineus]|uniref:Serine-rich protein n=1 Tax=Hymenoscyphus fraxineus TaxID=746836 RepID=A0A9N9KQG7_9HELO|nr:hypothetical protein HYFRA_00000770 [Hymenoscyphus fraxineus]
MSELPRRPLHEQSESMGNSDSSKSNNSSQDSLQTKSTTTSSAAPIRLVPQTPPQLLGTSSSKLTEAKINTTTLAEEEEDRTRNRDGTHVRPSDAIYSRTPLPTHPSHLLPPPGKGKDRALANEFRTNPPAPERRRLSGSSVLPTHSTHAAPRNTNSDTGAPISKVKPPAKKRLQIHKDNKTFSLLQDDRDPQADGALVSPLLGRSRASSYDSLGSEARYAPGRSNSVESCLSSAPATPTPAGKKSIIADPITTASPWNYEIVGGIRKVPKTPDNKKRRVSSPPLPPVPEASDRPSAASHDLSTKLSFQSTQTTSTATTVSETSNYKVYNTTFASPSDVALAPLDTSNPNYQSIDTPSDSPSESFENYQLIGTPSEHTSEPSPNVELIGSPSETESNYQIIIPSSNASTASSVIHRPYTARSETISENQNYELYGDQSPTGSAANLITTPPRKQSNESSVSPPLRSKTNTRSNEHLGYYKSRSRESLRSGSFSSITTVLTQQEASRAFVGSGSLVTLPILNERSEGSSSWADKSAIHPPRLHMQEHPHQWSSQLSTVLSVTEGSDTVGRLSRDWASDSGGRRSAASGFPSISSDSRQRVLSVSSSLALEEAQLESLGRPEPAYARNGRRHQSSGSIPFVENQDEYGDGITDMQDLRSRPSRTRLSGFFSINSSDNGRTNTMRSTSSSRANSMLASAAIPTWAKLYYGSGERKYLGRPGSSTESTAGSRASSFLSGSPNTDHFPSHIYSPRRRPRERGQADTRSSTRGSMEINPAPQLDDPGFIPRYRAWSVSSVWSPHLRMDRRATRHSVWDPPSVNWSADGSSFGRRNIQIIMFVIGFIFPFSWMIASFLPLPLNPISEMRERDPEDEAQSHDFDRRFGPIDEKRFENARWWRNLNRWMSLVGLLIIAAIVVLVVVSVKEGWTITTTK